MDRKRRNGERPAEETREFAPGELEAALAAFDRRTFLKVMGASLAMAGTGELGGCWKPQPAERIVPYVSSPEHVVPGVPRFYASSLPGAGDGAGWVSGFGRGVIVEQHEGRPTKMEGNPRHPSSLGATDIFMQAAVLQLYDPDRSKGCLRRTKAAGGAGAQPVSWNGVLGGLRKVIEARGGAGRVRVRLLTGMLTSPTLVDQIAQLRRIFPMLVWHVDEALGEGMAGEGRRRAGILAGGKDVTPVYDFSKAKRIVSLDGHFLAEEAGSLRYAREWAQGRRLAIHEFGPNQTHVEKETEAPQLTPEAMSRLYVAECGSTFTGAVADRRVGVKPSMMAGVAGALARRLGGQGDQRQGLPAEIVAWVDAAAADLQGHGAESLVLVGRHQPAEIHALGAAMNGALGAVGKTVRYVEQVESVPEGADVALAGLAEALDAGAVDLLVMVEANPAYSAPGDLRFAERLARFCEKQGTLAIHLGGYVDETAELCDVHVPLAHPLEAWGDLRGHDGTVGIVQPLIEPLWGGKSAVEFFAALASVGLQTGAVIGGNEEISATDLYSGGYEIVRRYWMERWRDLAGGEREMRWRRALRDGIVEGTAAAEVTTGAGTAMGDLLAALAPLEKAATAGDEIVIRADPTLGDGAWANSGWLQELPKPLTRLTWETVAVAGPETGKRLGAGFLGGEAGQNVAGVRITVDGRAVEMPMWIVPGQVEGVVLLHLGGGRRSAGRVQAGVGVDVNVLRTVKNPWAMGGGGVRVEPAERTFSIACTQSQRNMEGRDVARGRGVDQLPGRDAPIQTPDLYSTKVDDHGRSVHLSLYDEYRYTGYKWGMVIDLSACIGCQACVVACQAENNIPVVGKDQVRRGREMHWIRIDTYFGSADRATNKSMGGTSVVRFCPMLCQHCENAPCEVVCPVEATSHSEEGINEMTYNRCVGTRYCSNNCPYKVRRFNFYQFNSHDELTINMQRNPNVTVRSRGVMEKCSYCIQRINRARIAAKRVWAQEEARASLHEPPVEMRTMEKGGDGWVMPRELPRMRVQTACQQACPTEAIVFGDINDTASVVSRMKSQRPWAAVNYGILTELNTQPRTSYLERIGNPSRNSENSAGATTNRGEP